MKKSRMQFLKFCLVGGVNSGVDFVLFALLAYGGVPYLAAQCISYMGGAANSYFMNRTWTFASSGHSIRTEALKFLALNLTSLCVASALLLALYQYMAWPLALSKIVSTCIGALLNYAGSRLWVFIPHHQARSDSV